MTGLLFPPQRLPALDVAAAGSALVLFGRYELVERLGEGVTTETFLARSDGLETLLRVNALKRLKPSLCADVDVVSRFIEEARIAVRVEHPGLVRVDDFGRVHGVYFIAREFVDGVTLEELLRNLAARGLALDPRAAVFIARSVASAVAAIHGVKRVRGGVLGLVHGDLHPRNVLIDVDGTVKLRNPSAPSSFRDVGTLVRALGLASVRRQAPDVLDGARPSWRTDAWALGALLWEMLAARPLFAGDTLDDVRSATREPIVPPSHLRRGLTQEVDVLVDAALVRTPEKRPEAQAWAERLGEFLAVAGYDADAFRATLARLDSADEDNAPASPEDETRIQRLPRREHGTKAPSRSGGAASEATRQLGAQLNKDPGPWGLVRFAERQARDGHTDDARAMFRAAAIVFASRGLLPQALCAWDGARPLLSSADADLDLRRLSALGAGDAALRSSELRRVQGVRYDEALRAQTDGLERAGTFATPFLGALSPDSFARLASLSRVVRVPAQRHVLREGEPGDSLFAVGEGRLVVTCTPSGLAPTDADANANADERRVERTDPGVHTPELPPVVVAESFLREFANHAPDAEELELFDPAERRVFLSALTAGDIFGEFSFLTRRPRSASVEAVTTCRLLEISRAALGDLLDENQALRDELEAFYKERVLEWMLAKNEVFSLLEPERRRALLAQCGVYEIPAGKTVVREGELHDAMYFIKRGEVEITLDDDGVAVFINKLGPGDFFGEIAALEGGPRRASVHAVTDLEVFRIGREDLHLVLEDGAEIKARLRQAMRARSAELKLRIDEQRRVLGST